MRMRLSIATHTTGRGVSCSRRFAQLERIMWDDIAINSRLKSTMAGLT